MTDHSSSPQPLLNYTSSYTTVTTIKENKTVDSFLRLSWYCARILLLAEFILLGSAGNMLFLVYAGASPKTVACIGKDVNIPDICKMEEFDISKHNCTLQPEYEFYSLNIEFGYFCKNTALVKGIISVQMMGILLGALFWGMFADIYGRRKALIITLTATVILSVINSYVNDLLTFNIVRGILSFFNGGALVVYAVYQMEHVPVRHRFLISSIISWSPNYIIVTCLAYLSGDWRTFQRILAIITLPVFPIFFFIFESPRWLIQMGRIEEARRVLTRMQAIDSINDATKEEMNNMIEDEHEKIAARDRKAKRYNISHLFRRKDMALATMTLSIGVMISSMISYGLMFNIETLSGSLFLNSIYLGLIRWALNLGSGILEFNIKWAGRKLFHTIYQVVVVVALLLMSLVYLSDNPESMFGVVRYATLIAAAFCSQTFNAKGMTSMEYFPTVIRNSAMSFKTTFSRIGSVIAPNIFFLPHKYMPYAILSGLAVIDTIAFMVFVPETKGKPLPETIPDHKKRQTLQMDDKTKLHMQEA